MLIGLSALPQPAIPANLIESHYRSGTPDGSTEEGANEISVTLARGRAPFD
jgi:hypothetical protein